MKWPIFYEISNATYRVVIALKRAEHYRAVLQGCITGLTLQSCITGLTLQGWHCRACIAGLNSRASLLPCFQDPFLATKSLNLVAFIYQRPLFGYQTIKLGCFYLPKDPFRYQWLKICCFPCFSRFLASLIP